MLFLMCLLHSNLKYLKYFNCTIHHFRIFQVLILGKAETQHLPKFIVPSAFFVEKLVCECFA